MKRTSLPLALVLSVAILFAATLACGGGAATSTPAGAGPTPATTGGGIQDIGDPCHLLLQADAEKLFGQPADPGKPNIGSNSASCVYTSGAGLLAVNVVYEDQAAKDSSDYTSASADAQPVSGLGDAAHFVKSVRQLTVAKGHWLIGVNATLGGTDQGLDALMPFAQAALSRLPS